MPSEAPQALLFDLGGVLVDIDFDLAISDWARYSSMPFEELKIKFQVDDQYKRYERGEIQADEYFDHVATILKLAASQEQIATGWNAIFVGEISATRLLVEAERRSLPCYAFTNTNASHMAYWSTRFPEIVAAFDRIFASHQIGLRKPERAAFEYICRATGISAGSFMFFDDLPENIHAASNTGFQTTLVRSPDDVANALRGTRAGANAQSCE